MTTKGQSTAMAQAIVESFQSPNVLDTNWEAANIVDVIEHLAREANRISTAICASAMPGTDETGGTVT